MKRRAIAIAAACAWVAAATQTLRAQTPAAPVVGLLSSRSPEEAAAHIAAFRQGLAEHGFDDAHGLRIEARWARGHYERLPAMAGELVAQRVGVLVAFGGSPASRAAQAATSTVPVVFVQGDDPVESALVRSLSRPEANVTGIHFLTSQLNGKRLALLCDVVPETATLAFLANDANPGSTRSQRDVEDAARTLGRPLRVWRHRPGQRLGDTYAAMAAAGVQALVVQNDPSFDSQREAIVALAARHRLAAIYHIREFPAAGGLMSYGASLSDAYRDAGRYAGRILQGARPGDLPVLRPTRFELVINARTARQLNLVLPPRLLVLADEILP